MGVFGSSLWRYLRWPLVILQAIWTTCGAAPAYLYPWEPGKAYLESWDNPFAAKSVPGNLVVPVARRQQLVVEAGEGRFVTTELNTRWRLFSPNALSRRYGLPPIGPKGLKRLYRLL